MDSLNALSYKSHYKNLDSTFYYAEQALRASGGYPSGEAEAMNNRAFYLFMKMDFHGARNQLLKIYSATDNELELLIADIGMMKICQRTSDNKEFYDYRNRAIRRLRRIGEEKENLDEKDKKRLIYAESEFHIVSSVYYYYLQQERQSMDEIKKVDPNGVIRKDTAQLLQLYYMKGSGGMCEGDSTTQITLREFDYLNSCIHLSKSTGYSYFEANSLQALAEMLLEPSSAKVLYGSRPKDIQSYNTNNLPDSLLPLDLSRKALTLFKHYDDFYQIAGTYRTVAACLFSLGKYHDALDSLQVALNYVNRHHIKYYHCTDSTHLLTLYRPGEKVSIEMQWLKGGKIKTVSEWIARLREQISLTYSALGMKPQSDYNRNIYLDILDVTRQDKEWESRYDTLEIEGQQMNILISVVLLALILIVMILVVAYRIWKKRNAIHIAKIRQALDLCQKVTSYIPDADDSLLQISSHLTENIRTDFCQLFACSDFTIWVQEEDDSEEIIGDESIEIKDYNYCFALPLADSGIKAEIRMQRVKKLSKDEKALLKVINPYIAWTLENASTFLLLGDRRKQLEKERYVYEQHIIDNKRQNLNKKACMALVNNITPFLDRIINEVNKLESTTDEKIKRDRYQYITELIDRINEYNEILSLWIKMRQGILSLHIENFPLSELFSIVEKGRMSFEMKKQTLSIQPTSAQVKADKALTLFMLNTLMENARKYTPEGGHITVEATESTDFIEISVADDGPGLSDDDVKRILGEKVYDSSQIGIQHKKSDEVIRNNKGYGFGLINCKGIIDKYKKSGSIFNVCDFRIHSTLGKGSRFSFRLPKSVMQIITVLVAVLLFASCYHKPETYTPAQKKALAASHRDSDLQKASCYADSAYYSNVYGYYQDALMYADSALHRLNAHACGIKRNSRIATITGEGESAEIKWFRHHYDTDYYILLDVRNEAAVAALALRKWDVYKYNNDAYTTLYKMVGEDHDIETFCKRMLASSNNKMVGLVVCILLFMALVISYYIIYFRQRMLYRLNLEQVLEINREVFACTTKEKPDTDEALQQIPQIIIDRIFMNVDALRPVKALSMAVYNDNTHQFNMALRQISEIDSSRLEDLLHQSYEKQTTIASSDKQYVCYPLIVDIGDMSYCIGSLGVILNRYTEEGDSLLGQLITRYISIAVFNTTVRMQHSLQEIDEAQNDKQRAIFEETQLHIQNQVLDNCFSTLKHETLYYPTRIRQVVGKLTESCSKDVEREQQDTLSQLVNYYKEIFTLLSSCASRQLQEVTFKRTAINVKILDECAKKYVDRMNRRKNTHVVLHTDMNPCTAIGDLELLQFLIEYLIEEATDTDASVTDLFLKAYPQDRFIRFEFTNPHREMDSKDLEELFYPRFDKMCNSDGTLHGTEFLLCKQIIRDHDEYTGHCGCRIIAQKEHSGGTTIWWTILAK